MGPLLKRGGPDSSHSKEGITVAFLESIHERAKANKKRIIFPECRNPMMLRAATRAEQEGLADVVILDNREELESIAAQNGIDLGGVEVVNAEDMEYRADLAERYAKLPGKILGRKYVEKSMRSPVYMALVMEAVGDGDVTFAGLETTTYELIMAAQGIIGFSKDVVCPSIMLIMEIEGFKGDQGNLIGMSDGGINVLPTSGQLAGIAVSCCDSFKALVGKEPRCAFLSYSTDGSGTGEGVDRVREGVRIARENRPDLLIDGEFQADAAVNARIGAKKVKRESDVAGHANMLIFPDIASCNIASKLIQQFAPSRTYGPVIQGFNQPIVDCSRGDTEETIYNNIAVSSVLASFGKKA